ncbi:hypothetical protein O6H91_18G034500 [Diphasiastrum complanatum]|uniref:Uncharacterized protein n=1 Tax=Diphasiastrum complanatum TaxID=34168 RepID=A0ACC2AZT9_DIPCM|nr:hypothetical protein O6H91_18G034500 [Diphasiastrum complanatum]
MLGKRPRQMRRTVSVSMMGPGSTTPELPTDKTTPSEEVPTCCTHRQGAVSHSYEAGKAQSVVSQTENGSCYKAAPVLPFSIDLNHSGPRPWQSREAGAVGLGIVAALHATDAHMNNSVKDSRDRAPPAVLTHKPVNQNRLLPLANPHAHNKQQHHQHTEIQKPRCSHRRASASSVKVASSIVSPGMHFLEVCCFCRRKLSHGRDIYMYRGDKAFCSEECRHQQILIDERKEKCFLTTLKMRTAQSVHSSGQRSRAMAASTAAG